MIVDKIFSKRYTKFIDDKKVMRVSFLNKNCLNKSTTQLNKICNVRIELFILLDSKF